MNHLRTSLQIALLLIQTPIALAATTWYVNGPDGSDSHDCKSPLTACKTIGHAISLAASGDAVTIADATYVENVTIPVSLTVTGSGAGGPIIDGNGHTSVVKIPNASTHVTLSNVTLQNGWAEGGCPGRLVGGAPSCGGGIYNTGTLTVNNSRIINNVADGRRSCNIFFPTRCSPYEAYGFGGGIYNSGTLKINRTTIAANRVAGVDGAGGGGIYNLGKLTINASTLSGNHAAGNPLSVCSTTCTSNGGGIDNIGTAEINNSTLA